VEIPATRVITILTLTNLRKEIMKITTWIQNMMRAMMKKTNTDQEEETRVVQADKVLRACPVLRSAGSARRADVTLTADMDEARMILIQIRNMTKAMMKKVMITAMTWDHKEAGAAQAAVVDTAASNDQA
jgi:hypothetical protein